MPSFRGTCRPQGCTCGVATVWFLTTPCPFLRGRLPALHHHVYRSIAESRLGHALATAGLTASPSLHSSGTPRSAVLQRCKAGRGQRMGQLAERMPSDHRCRHSEAPAGRRVVLSALPGFRSMPRIVLINAAGCSPCTKLLSKYRGVEAGPCVGHGRPYHLFTTLCFAGQHITSGLA